MCVSLHWRAGVLCDLFFLYCAERTASRWWRRVHSSEAQFTVSSLSCIWLGVKLCLHIIYLSFSPQICDLLPGQKLGWHLPQRASRRAFVVLVNWWFRLVDRYLSFLGLIFYRALYSFVEYDFLLCVYYHTHCISVLIRKLKGTQAHLWLLVGTWFFYLSTSIYNNITSCFLFGVCEIYTKNKKNV